MESGSGEWILRPETNKACRSRETATGKLILKLTLRAGDYLNKTRRGERIKRIARPLAPLTDASGRLSVTAENEANEAVER
ncbi:hypothetical protein ASG35_00360 [Burkholderia sp. Leaf177]|nr:hypothetical protein ASG35_00360 [Burkholderia sp. Leaf177]